MRAQAAGLPSWPDVSAPAMQLTGIIWEESAARIGQAAVASAFVHTFDPSSPDSVAFVVGADAGSIFYRRRIPGQIIHLDIFHEVGEVDHTRVAAWVRRALQSTPYGESLADQVDVQTGTGGGRVSGSLRFGRKVSLRRAHMNHVHLAARLDRHQSDALLWLVAGAEAAVMESGLQIRQVRRLQRHVAAPGETQDLSPYSSPSDSMLREESASGLEEAQMMQSAMEISDELGGTDEMRRALEEIAAWEEMRAMGSMNRVSPSSGWDDVVEKLISGQLARREGRRVVLTDKGWELHDFLTLKSREIEMQFRRLLRKASGIKPPRDRASFSETRAARPGKAWGMRPMTLPPGEWPHDIALPETIAAALARCPHELSVVAEDLRTYRDRSKRSADVCLLIDASASMAGKRIRAAKYLAQHLLLASREKIAVVVFQEGSVKIEVPFTRKLSFVQAGLARVQPMGLTPLAEGLIQAAQFIKEARSKKPLLLLITDGIPTVPKWTLNPLEDALQAASMLERARMRFGCIGLQPNKSFLQTLSRRAHGTLYVVDELERETLASIANRERWRP
jgi:magnesium chelatase subunit D